MRGVVPAGLSAPQANMNAVSVGRASGACPRGRSGFGQPHDDVDVGDFHALRRLWKTIYANGV